MEWERGQVNMVHGTVTGEFSLISSVLLFGLHIENWLARFVSLGFVDLSRTLC